MKKTIIISLIFLISGSLASAQDRDLSNRNALNFGLKVGFNYSNIWDTRGEDFRANPKAGFAGGFFLGIPLGRYWGFQPEVLVSQKGFKANGSIVGLPYSFTRTTTFIDFPLQIQYKPVEFVTFVGGPQFSYLIRAKNVYHIGNSITEVEQEFSNDNIRKNIFGFVLGVDFSYSHIVLSGRVGWDFQNNSGDGTSTSPRYKNRWLQTTVGYRF
jgi:hypothetical protein